MLLLFLLFISVQADVIALPSNLTKYSANFRISGSPLNDTEVVALRDLRFKSDASLKSFNISGTATQVTSDSSLHLNPSEIALISCDSNSSTGKPGVNDIIGSVISAQSAAAVLLYSQSATHCNLTINDPTAAGYSSLFTLYSPNITSALQRTFAEPNPFLSIVPMTGPINGMESNSEQPGGSGDGPNTAMIILYSITGIITALFLGIIITGAVRAHRHPERYGPRRIAGRVRQSRARGIAKAMLDTIPVVKYGDRNNDVEATKHDVELNMEGATQRPPRDDGSTEPTTPVSESPIPGGPERPTSTAPEATKNESTSDTGNFSCPICTDDFIKGQDLRVLPCHHQFHVECVDPWLVNSSGTCPLCRIDLNPPQSETTEQPEGNTNRTAVAEAPGAETTQVPNGRRRLSSYLHAPLNPRRMREATDEERLAPVRRARENNPSPTEAGLRTRLTLRLRDRFGIRTRTHGEPDTQEPEGQAPAAPAPAHIPPPTT